MRLRRNRDGDSERNRLPRWEQLLLCLCDLLGVGWETNQDGWLRLRDKNPSKGSVLDRLDQLEARVAEVEAENAEGRRTAAGE